MYYRDQLHRPITLTAPPRRIVSLVPSQTELLAYLGLDEEVVGITRFCVRPEHWFRTKVRVGGTKKVKLATVATLAPDLILANKEENEKSDIEALATEYPVWVSDINDLATALTMIREVGKLTARSERAEQLISDICTAFDHLATQLSDRTPLRVAYLIWQKPLMVAGNDTFINAMLKQAGLQNIFTQPRYPAVSLADLQNEAPDVLLLASEPFPFREKHRREWQKLCPQTVVVLVDGEAFSWYGSRLLQAAPYFAKLRAELSADESRK